MRAEDRPLFLEYYKTKTLCLRNQLVERNDKLCCKIGRDFLSVVSHPLEDLIQVGRTGLIVAVEKFDPHRGIAFSSFAAPYIRGRIQHYIRDKIAIVRIPRRYHDYYSKGQKITRQARAKGQFLTPKEIADRLEISLQEWQQIEMSARNRQSLLEVNPARIKNYSPECEPDDLNLPPLAYNRLTERQWEAIELYFIKDVPLTKISKLLMVNASQEIQNAVATLAAEDRPDIDSLKERDREILKLTLSGEVDTRTISAEIECSVTSARESLNRLVEYGFLSKAQQGTSNVYKCELSDKERSQLSISSTTKKKAKARLSPEPQPQALSQTEIIELMLKKIFALESELRSLSDSLKPNRTNIDPSLVSQLLQ